MPCNGKFWSIYGHFEYFVTVWYIIFQLWYVEPRKNLATLGRYVAVNSEIVDLAPGC
jgi:hypothetical protein